MNVRIQMMPSGSRPFAGSSRITTGGSPSSASASPRRCAIPSEKPPAPARRDVCETDEAEHLVDPGVGDAVRRRAHPEVVAGRATGVHRLGVEERPHRPHRVAQLAVGTAVERRAAGVGAVEREHHPHRGRLAGAVRPHEARDRARVHREGEVVDGHGAPEPLADAPHLDLHRGDRRGGAREEVGAQRRGADSDGSSDPLVASPPAWT